MEIREEFSVEILERFPLETLGGFPVKLLEEFSLVFLKEFPVELVEDSTFRGILDDLLQKKPVEFFQTARGILDKTPEEICGGTPNGTTNGIS